MIQDEIEARNSTVLGGRKSNTNEYITTVLKMKSLENKS